MHLPFLLLLFMSLVTKETQKNREAKKKESPGKKQKRKVKKNQSQVGY